jgi:hypothetical protein
MGQRGEYRKEYMGLSQMNVCAICGGRKLGTDRWFLIAENRWEDKLKVLKWNDRLAAHAGIQRACSAAHVEELVVHWMTTGSLGYPFARTKLEARGVARIGDIWNTTNTNDVDTWDAHLIGELAVHRESMERVLFESPQSLQTILDALLGALRRETAGSEAGSEPEDELHYGILQGI